MKQPSVLPNVWPKLPNTEWTDALATLHLWTQIVGKVRLELSPWLNHSWQATLYVTSRGLTTSAIPYGGKTLQIEDPIPFPEDLVHSSYEPEQVHLFWRALGQSARVFEAFRARFIGKCSPVHLFWGSFDLAVTRFSGRPAPKHPGGIPNLPDVVTVEAYSKEVSSCGFWPGNASAPDPIFYSYAYPVPEGFAEHRVKPDSAFWLADLGEFVLPYEAVRTSDDPDATLMAFLESTYEAAADLANWDRADFERPAGYTPYQPEG